MDYGLIGGRLDYSLSPEIHRQLGSSPYDLCACTEEEARSLILSKDFKGLNVTNPYKKLAYELAEELTPEARQMGSVNTLWLKNGVLMGMNTDGLGFQYLLSKLSFSLEGKTCLIVGNGATGQMAAKVLEGRKAKVKILSRRGQRGFQDLQYYGDGEVLINATPIGVRPNVLEEYPIQLKNLPKLKAVIDVNYNPLKTKLLAQAEGEGLEIQSGLAMLVAQAFYASELFQGKKLTPSLIETILKSLEKNLTNIVLVGMPGAGKTTLGEQLAISLNRPFVDTDEELEKRLGMSPGDFIVKNGETAFRKEEAAVLSDVLQSLGQVIATGGGTPILEENQLQLSLGHRVFWILRPLKELAVTGRPLAQGGMKTLEELYRRRKEIYQRVSHGSVNNEAIQQSVEELRERFYEDIRN